jgi:phage terminase Nu1 subunit (DNA packaging protein)
MTNVASFERYVDRRELAEIMGVHVNTIDKLTAEGMPSETWGMRARRFLPSEAIAWAKQRSIAA